MTYVVQTAEEEPRWAYHNGFVDIHDAQTCTNSVRSAESRRKANKKKYHNGFAGSETTVC